MSGKTSFIIIAILVVVVTVFVYHYSVPAHHGHVSVLGGEDSLISHPAMDSAKARDSAEKNRN